MIFNSHIGKTGGYTAKQIGESGARNLVPFPYYEKAGTENGIEWIINDDGTVYVKGTATANVSFTLRATSEKWILPKGNYILSGCPDGGSFSTYRLQLARFIDGTLTSYVNEYGTGAVANITDDLPLLLQFVVAAGVEIDATIKPMLEVGSVAHGYIPYYFGGAEKAKTAENAANATHAVNADTAANALKIAGYELSQLYKSVKVLTSADDLDTLLELGLYYYTSADIPKNAPYQNASFVEVLRFNDNRQLQRVTRAGVSGYRTERVYSGSWQGWAYDLNDTNYNKYALPLNGGGTVTFTDYMGFKLKRNIDSEAGGVCVTFANNIGNAGMVGFKNKKFIRVNVSNWEEYEVLDVSNSAKVVINESAPSDTTALWVY